MDGSSETNLLVNDTKSSRQSNLSPSPIRKRENSLKISMDDDKNEKQNNTSPLPSPSTSPRSLKGKGGWAKIKRELISKPKENNNNNNNTNNNNNNNNANNNNDTTTDTTTATTTTTATLTTTSSNKTTHNNNNCETMSPPKSPLGHRKNIDSVISYNNINAVNNNDKKKMKLLILGEDGVGKSAFIVRFLTRRFIGEYDPLLEGVFRKCITINRKELMIEMKDTAKGINWHKRGTDIIWADAFILIYSITDKNSFNEIQKISKNIDQQKRARGTPCLLVGNKKDMSHERKVTFIEGNKLASSINGTFCELSVSDNYADLEGVLNHFIKENYVQPKQGNQVNQLKILTSKSSPEIRRNREDRLAPQQTDFPKIVIESEEVAKTERKGRALWQKLLTNNDFKKTKK